MTYSTNHYNDLEFRKFFLFNTVSGKFSSRNDNTRYYTVR